MFATPAYAADAGSAASGGGAGLFMSIAPMLLIFVIFYFLLIRPQQKRMKSHQAMLSAVKRGDTVVTNGGLIGKVTKVDDSEIEIELAPSVRVRAVKGMLAEVRESGGKPANDTAPAEIAPATRTRGKRGAAKTDDAGPDLTKSEDPVGSND